MSYNHFKVEDFVLDKKFRQWILSPDAESNLFWQSWLHHHPEKKAVLQEARNIILKMPSMKHKWDKEMEDSLWQAIEEDTQKADPPRTKVLPLHSAAVLESSHRELRRKPYFSHAGKVAAVILLVLICGAAVYVGLRGNHSAQMPVAYVAREVPLGTKARFSLPDGTHVVMNAGSSMRYPEHFSSDERLVSVQGEIYFDVARDSLRPFRVKTGAVVTEALGTAFNVLYEKNRMEIALIEGKVQVSLTSPGARDKLILAPGERASLQDDAYLVRDPFDVEKVTAWTRGIILFKGAGEQEVINTLERWYGVDIVTKGQSSKPWNFLGKFEDKSLEYVLQSMAYTMNFHYTIEGDTITIDYL